jgi:asparagine synthase (glutamine-hydrolysing)
MCGICGKVYGHPERRVELSLIRRMADLLQHRGPDAEGFHVRNEAGLGHRRLKIIDLEGGRQPMFNEDGSVVITFNGEIYNFQDLRQELRKCGHVFQTNSDTEVLIHGYEQWQTELLPRLRGMFAFAIWDDRRKSLFMARDRMGKKPLYYFSNEHEIVFASELKSLLVDPDVPREIDAEALDAYFALGYIPSPKTIYRNVCKLLPATYLIWQGGETKTVAYWDCFFHSNGHYEEAETIETLRSRLTDAVQVRLISDVPLGAFLSGGLDSSCVVALMSRLKKEPVVAATVGFHEEEFDEVKYSRMVATHCGMAMYEHVVTPDLESLLPKLVWHFDEPFADSSAVPTYYVSQVARRHVTVALSGDGGDESFAGYTRRYRFEALESYWRERIPGWIRTGVIRPAASLYPKADWLPRCLRAKSVLTNLASSAARGYFNSLSITPARVRRKLFSDDFIKNVDGDFAYSLFARLFEESKASDPVSRAQYVDLKTFLAEDVLVKVDRMSMAHGLEVRSPLLDHQVVEYAAGLPSHAKLRNGVSKFVLKRAMEELLPPAIVYRGKHGFEAPVAKWLRHGLKRFAEGYLFESPGADGIFDGAYLSKMWQAHQRGTQNHAFALWSVLMYKIWHDAIHKNRDALGSIRR